MIYHTSVLNKLSYKMYYTVEIRRQQFRLLAILAECSFVSWRKLLAAVLLSVLLLTLIFVRVYTDI